MIKVLEWVTMEEDKRPHWISLYLSEPDHTAHGFGPNTTEVNIIL